MRWVLIGIAVVMAFVTSTQVSAASGIRHCDQCFGTYTWAGGDKYFGEWKKGKLHGRGTFIYTDGLSEFVDGVIPILQDRGLFRTEYESRLLRENLGLPIPENTWTKGITPSG